MKLSDVIRKPRFTEKTYLNVANNKYVFDVDTHAGKQDIKEAVEKLFDVSVVSVRTIMVRGKRKARGAYRRHFIRTSKVKKAIVEVAEGQTIKIFDEIFKTKD